MRPRHLISAAFVAVVAVLGVWSFWGNVVQPHPGGPPAAVSPLPPSLAGLPLATSLVGEEAVVSVEQLHGKTLGAGLDDAWVGEYGGGSEGGGGAATVWVSRSVSPGDARELLERMTDRIGEGGSPFTGLVPIQEDGVEGYRLEGMGQVHYYFLSGSDVYWLAADPALAGPGLDELLAAAAGTTAG